MALLLTGAADARAAGRVALVMAAEDYQKLPRSSVGLKRGQAIADALTARGFDVILSTNPSNAAARASLRDFSAKAADADLALAILIGHGTAWGGQSFFLPTNTEISRATDLLSRGLSITNVAQIAGHAKSGGVLFFMTIPNFGTPIEGLDARPQFTGEIGKNTFAAFSSSARVPVSRVDAASEQAAEALAKLLQQPAPNLGDAVKVAASGNMGAIFGTAADVDLAKPPPSVVAQPVALTSPPPSADAEKKSAIEGKLEAERQARALAEAQMRAEQVRVEQARAELQKAQADAQKAQAEAERAQAEAERAKLEAKQTESRAQVASAQPEIARPAAAAAAAPIEDSQLGQKQRQMIQKRLKELGLYTGPVDSIMGPLTREAIMGFQKSRGAAVTGYLTADQFEALLPKAE